MAFAEGLMSVLGATVKLTPMNTIFAVSAMVLMHVLDVMVSRTLV